MRVRAPDPFANDATARPMTTPFYAPPDAFRNGTVELPDDEAHHAARVLRKQPGDEIVVVDGAGGWHRVRLDQVDRRRAAGTVVETRREVGEPPYALTIGLGLLKHRNRLELFLEKAVEAGVRRIVPLVTARTERERIKEARSHNILVAAMKQSLRCRLVELLEPRPLDELWEEDAELKLICHEQTDEEAGMLGALLAHPEARRISVLVGPEGGFTEEEVEAARDAGYRPVSLGPRRLRAETAALVAAAAVMLAKNH